MDGTNLDLWVIPDDASSTEVISASLSSSYEFAEVDAAAGDRFTVRIRAVDLPTDFARYYAVAWTSVPRCEPESDFEVVLNDAAPEWVTDPDADGRVLYYEGAMEDITERVQAEAEIERLARFPGESPNPMLRVARDGTLV